MLQLEQCGHLGRGTVKNVYQHPYEPALVIKTIRPELVAQDGGFAKHGRVKRAMAQGVYRQFRRELIQYLQLSKVSYSEQAHIFPMETPYGLIPTSEGLGLVTEKILGPDGTPQTLEDLTKVGSLQDKHFQALERFFDECVALHLVFGEVNDAGLMYTESRTGRPEFVLVDGIGEKLLIPVRSWFRSVNARYIRTVQQRILAQVARYTQERAAAL
ncbi:MAG: YrbL family protein [Comamonas sp.]